MSRFITTVYSHLDVVTGGLTALTGSDRTRLVIVEDPKVGKHTHEERAQLRSLPLLYEFGFDRYLHTPLWENGFRMADYEYVDPNGFKPESASYPLVHVVSERGLVEGAVVDGDHDELERTGEQHVLRSLLRKRRDEDLLVIVTDTNAPRTPAYSSRPINDEFGPVTTVDYERLVERHVRTNLDSAIPLNETRNYFFHRASDYHRRVGAPAESLLELFDYERAPPGSPVWEPLYYFVEHDLQLVLEKYTERIRETLRSWLERGDVTKIATEMDAILTGCEYRADLLDERRRQNGERHDYNTVTDDV